VSARIIRAVPLSLREANAFVKLHHRHHGEVDGHKLAFGAECPSHHKRPGAPANGKRRPGRPGRAKQ